VDARGAPQRIGAGYVGEELQIQVARIAVDASDAVALPDFTRQAFGWAVRGIIRAVTPAIALRDSRHCSLHHSVRPTPSAQFE
jgi:hypothetical protein